LLVFGVKDYCKEIKEKSTSTAQDTYLDSSYEGIASEIMVIQEAFLENVGISNYFWKLTTTAKEIKKNANMAFLDARRHADCE